MTGRCDHPPVRFRSELEKHRTTLVAKIER